MTAISRTAAARAAAASTAAASLIMASHTPMQVHRSIQSMRSARRLLEQTKTVGFVPTMGALHEGHLSLVRQARKCNDIVVASIFVNPAQFGPSEDLDKYPRQFETDAQLLTEHGVDFLFAPDAAMMYGKNHVTYVEPKGFDDIPEGRVRPGHFRGVATIVTKLFNIVQPDTAYFGQKDAAQCVVIRRLVEDLDMDIDIEVHDTVREADGLAMSSRNAYLTKEERRAAPVIYRALCAARSLYQAAILHQRPMAGSNGVLSSVLQQQVVDVLGTEPLVSEIQYVSVDDKQTMNPVAAVKHETGAIISLACKVGSVRLIDNIVL